MSDPSPKEIRDAYQDYRDAWREIRDAATEDMRAISVEGPWTDEDRDARKGSGRPCIHLDQLNQFLAQVNGNVRKSKRAIKAIPKGNGANDQDAQKRSAAIMGIEERSQAQPIYLGAFQSMLERSYGFSIIRTEYKDQGFDMEILIKPIQNPDTVLLSPYYKQADASDVADAFFLDLIPKKQFKQKYPDARVTDFGDQDLNDSTITDWIKDKYLQIAEYWKIQTKLRTKLLVRGKGGPTEIWEDELEKGSRGDGGRFLSPRKTVEIIRERDVEFPEVFQYMTNGLEILDKVPWDGTRVPIISCLGPERWTTEGGKPKRQLLSMVRFARDPQMLYDYLVSGQCEVAGKIPKVPFVGAVGQFETDKEAWDELTKVPHAYVQYDLVLDSGGQAAPPPDYKDFTPNFQDWEVAKDATGRSIQAAMGITPLPDAAQRRNQKSGVALEKIDDMESLGSFQFVDRFETGYLHNMGWQINELITPVLDTQREMPISSPDGKRSTMQLVGNTSHPLAENGTYEVQGLDPGHLHTGKGDFDVTLSTGPSQESERQEQDEFVDSPDSKSRRPAATGNARRESARARHPHAAHARTGGPADRRRVRSAAARSEHAAASASCHPAIAIAVTAGDSGKLRAAHGARRKSSGAADQADHAADEGRRRQPAGTTGERHQSAARGNRREVARRAAAPADVSRILERKSRRGARSRDASDGAPARCGASAADGEVAAAGDQRAGAADEFANAAATPRTIKV